MRARALIISLLLVAITAEAQARPVALSKRYDGDKKLGVGLMLGTPTAVTGKYFLTTEVAVDLALGLNVLRKRDGFHAHADLLWHPFVAVDGITLQAPFYVGAGVRFLSHDGISRIGLRIPFGISFDFTDKPFDIFAELTPIFDLSVSDDGRGVADISTVVGFRYFL
jgi:hypothetical protein